MVDLLKVKIGSRLETTPLYKGHQHSAADITSGLLAASRAGLQKPLDLTGLLDGYSVRYNAATDTWIVVAASTPGPHATTHEHGGIDLVEPSWSDIQGKPLVYPPESHGHAESEITDLVDDLGDRELLAHKGAANGYPSLDASTLIPYTQIPVISSPKIFFDMVGRSPRLGAIAFAPGYVYLVPINAPFFLRNIYVTKVGWVLWSKNSNANLIGGVYADNGNTPAGGALIVQSASAPISGDDLRTKEIDVAKSLLPTDGVVWAAIEADAATPTYTFHEQENLGGTFEGKIFNRGSYGPLPDPCPAVEGHIFPPIMHLIVST